MKKENQQEKKKIGGITLIALVITIIVLLILAGVTIATLTGENGILSKASDAKEQTEIGTEKEQLNLAVTDVKTEGFIANKKLLNKLNLQNALDKVAGKGKTTVEGEAILTVTFNDSKRSYFVTAEGEVLIDLDQSNIYEYTEDGYITGIKEKYIHLAKVNKNSKYASLPNIKVAVAVQEYYLVDELNGVLVIPNKIGNTKIIGIEEGAFNSIKNLKQVIISEGIVVIKDSAFNYCQELNDIQLPNSLQQIGSWVFSSCISLRRITIPSEVSEIGERTFSYCDSLERIILDGKEGTILGEPWGADTQTQIIYEDGYISFANEYLSNKESGELEELILKSAGYIGTFENYLSETGGSREEIKQEAESIGMTYDNYLKEVLMRDDVSGGIGDYSWVRVEYYISLRGWANKTVEELEEIYISKIGETGTFDEFLSKQGMTREEFENFYKEEGFKTEEDFLKVKCLQD